MPNETPYDVAAVLDRIGDLRSRFEPAPLTVFLEELFRWNSQLGLVSKQNTPDVVVRLICQGAALWDFACSAVGGERMGRVERVLDIGSGGGFPGLVWKMLAPSREFLLVERKERKVAFLERVIARAGLEKIAALAADVRELARRESSAASFDLAAMAAVAPPSEVAAAVERLLRSPGYLCTLRGREQEAPEERLGHTLQLLSRLDTPVGRYVLYGRGVEPEA